MESFAPCGPLRPGSGGSVEHALLAAQRHQQEPQEDHRALSLRALFLCLCPSRGIPRYIPAPPRKPRTSRQGVDVPSLDMSSSSNSGSESDLPEWPPTPAASQRKPNGATDLEQRTRGLKRARSASPPPARAQPAHAPAASSSQTTSKPRYLRRLMTKRAPRKSSGKRYDAVPPTDSSSEESTTHAEDLEPEPLQTSLSYLIRELQWRSKEKQAPRHRGLKGRSWAHWLIVVVRERGKAHSAQNCR